MTPLARIVLISAATGALLVPAGCNRLRGCSETTLSARPVGGSGEASSEEVVLEARLLRGDEPYAGADIAFDLLVPTSGAGEIPIGGGKTDANGVARFNAGALTEGPGLYRKNFREATAYRAEFDPTFQELDEKLCAAEDEASFSFGSAP